MTLIRVCRELILPPAQPAPDLNSSPLKQFTEKRPRDLCHGDPDRLNNLPTTCKPAPKTLLLYHLHQDEDGGQDAVISYLKVSLWMSSSLLLKYWST